MPLILTINPISPPSLDDCTFTEQQKIVASDGTSNEEFGWDMSMSKEGNTIVIGADAEDLNEFNLNHGAAYVYTRSGGTWSEIQKIVADDRQPSDNFGHAVAISGDGNTIIAGAPNEDSGFTNAQGAAYVFTNDGSPTWTQQQKILLDLPSDDDNFGWSIALSDDGDIAVISALRDDSGASNAGAVYVYNRSGSTYTLDQQLISSVISGGDFFGRSVAISRDGTTIVVGASGVAPSSAGAAYVFTNDGSPTWTEKQKIVGSDTAGGDNFGWDVAVSDDGTTIIVGAQSQGGTSAGAAYVFTGDGNTWTQEQKITASDAGGSDFFGRSVAISDNGNAAVVGAFLEGTGDDGQAYIFTRSAGVWSEKQIIVGSDTANGDRFGYSAAMSGNGFTAAVGAYLENSSQGAAYIFICE